MNRKWQTLTVNVEFINLPDDTEENEEVWGQLEEAIPKALIDGVRVTDVTIESADIADWKDFRYER